MACEGVHSRSNDDMSDVDADEKWSGDMLIFNDPQGKGAITRSEPSYSDFSKDREKSPAYKSGGSSNDEDDWNPSHDIEDAGRSVGEIQKVADGKRKYQYINRKRNTRCVSGTRKRWDKRLKASDEKISKMKCCKSRRCFNVCNTSNLREKMKIYLAMKYDQRRTTLRDMIGSEGSFLFDRKVVCSLLLIKAFRFSRDMQAVVRCTNGSRSSRSKESVEELRDEDWNSTAVSHTNGTRSDKSSPQKDSVISFLERLAENVADKMPDSPQQHLPFCHKTEMSKEFLKEYVILHGIGTNPPSESYFLEVWSKYCSLIKVRKSSRFSRCTICEELEDSIKEATSRHQCTKELKFLQNAHREMIRPEGLEYKKKRDTAMLQPKDCLYIIFDGADQSAFELPHFVVKTKAERGHEMKIKLVGFLQHIIPKRKLRLFSVTEEYETGANHIIESIHCCINDIHSHRDGHLPRTMFLHLDNCTRENKNRSLFSYLESLVPCESIQYSVDICLISSGCGIFG